MSSQGKWKLLGVAIIAVAILGGVVGWQQFAPKPVPPTIITVTPTATTVAGTQKTVAPMGSVNYYLGLLEANGTQPYVQLANELRKLPDLTNATAAAKITWLALNATNPEVKEAFELMIKGGTPDPKDFKYSVPNYNTELQVLYWLASQNEFKKDDTLALAIALVNGIWVTMGDDAVRESARQDLSRFLTFFRETGELQRQKWLPNLEAYPLEALICLCWLGNMNGFGGPRGLAKGSQAAKVDLKLYKWIMPEVDTMRQMRETAVAKQWVGKGVDATVANIEEYFHFSGFGQHWTRAGEERESQIEVDGERIKNWEIYNVDFYFRHFIETGRGLGDCGDESAFVDAWVKSLGTASNFVIHQKVLDGKYYGHAHIIYYEPLSKVWKAYHKQLSDSMYYGYSELEFWVFIFKPPVLQPKYFLWTQIEDSRVGRGGRVFVAQYSVQSFRTAFQEGFPTPQMKQWLLYS